MNIVLIAVSIILIISALGGLHAGFLRKASGILSFILAGILASMLLPGISSWLRTSTPVYATLQKQCAAAGETIVKNMISTGTSQSGDGSGISSLFGGTGSSFSGSDGGSASSGSQSASGQGSALWDTILNSDGSVKRQAVKNLLQQYGYDPAAIDGMSDEEIKSFITQYTGISAGFLDLGNGSGFQVRRKGSSLLPGGLCAISLPDLAGQGMPGRLTLLTAEAAAGENSQEEEKSLDLSSLQPTLSALLSSMPAADRRKLIESLPIPESLQEQMETFNNSEGYKKLGVSDFASYITSYFASLIMNVIAYIVSLLIAWIILHLIFKGLGIFTRLPLIHQADRILGLAVGLLQGVFIVWGLFLILSMVSATSFGQSVLTQVHQSPFLEALYNSNMFLNSASLALKGIL